MGGDGGGDDIIRKTIMEKNVGRVRPARAQQCGLAGELQFRLWHSSPWHATDQVVSRSWRSWGLKRLLRNRRQEKNSPRYVDTSGDAQPRIADAG